MDDIDDDQLTRQRHDLYTLLVLWTGETEWDLDFDREKLTWWAFRRPTGPHLSQHRTHAEARVAWAKQVEACGLATPRPRRE